MRLRHATVLALLVATTAGCTVSAPSGPTPTSPPSPRPSATAGQAGAGDPYYPDDGNGGYDVLGYDVTISYDPKTRHLDGDTTVTATAKAPLKVFNFDLKGFTVKSVEVEGKPAKFARSGAHELVITPGKPAGGTFHTRVRYSGTPMSAEEGNLGVNGWQISTSGGAFVAGEPHSAAYWYPVNDTPRDKATFTLAARVPDGWSVISNGKEGKSAKSGGWTTYHWTEPNRVASYLTTVAIDHWTFDRGTLPGGTPIVSAYAPGAESKKSIEARLPEIIAFLSSKFGPYPQSAAGGIYLADSIGFSLETQTRPIYAQWTDLNTVVHENAHQWYGDSVSVDAWADICMNECFASYAQWLWSEAKEGKNLDDLYRSTVSGAGKGFWAGKLYDMGQGNEFTAVYTKGPVALHALRRQIGDNAFDKLLHDWAAQHRDGNATFEQFQTLAEQDSGQNLDKFFDAWFRGTTKPTDVFLYPGSLHK
ncbi:M1 family metallopeptidase [Labedaea rhizosphaerae]|uniref:Aminopeptidase N n=1 Tax=Labedaea rhizosphaerae TaxID=598644 RepID=A0A4R6SMA4_LABRH|nr:M1 family metallopeptidase [Labedaea rhizosphaerae]TDQ04690.1 peptidase M1-like protein [Labedaea rhizosphaerae]